MYEVEKNYREVKQRKHDYWRGFKAASIILAIPLIALVAVIVYGLNSYLVCFGIN